MFIYFWERERETASGGGAEKERETGSEDLMWALCWQQRAPCGTRTHEPWDHDLSWIPALNWWATQVPLVYLTYLLLTLCMSLCLSFMSSNKLDSNLHPLTLGVLLPWSSPPINLHIQCFYNSRATSARDVSQTLIPCGPLSLITIWHMALLSAFVDIWSDICHFVWLHVYLLSSSRLC